MNESNQIDRNSITRGRAIIAVSMLSALVFSGFQVPYIESAAASPVISNALAAHSATWANLPMGVVGETYSAQPGSVLGGTYTAEGLPAGLQINLSTGLVYGTPSTSGTFTVNVTVNIPAQASEVRGFTLTIAAKPIWGAPAAAACQTETSGSYRFTDVISDRFSGANRIETATLASQRAFPDSACTVFLVNGFNFPDGLSASPMTNPGRGVILQTKSETLPQETAAEITRLHPKNVVIVGSTGSVSPAVEAQVRALSATVTVTRVGGDNRYATNQALVNRYYTGHVEDLYIAAGQVFPDALSVGGVAAKMNAPMILVLGTNASLDATTLATIQSLTPTRIHIAGGINTISTGIEDQLRTIAAVDRLAGESRYDTSLALNNSVFGTSEQAFLVYGGGYADALGSGGIGYRANGPAYLTPNDCLNDALTTALANNQAQRVTLFGGMSTLGQNIADRSTCSTPIPEAKFETPGQINKTFDKDTTGTNTNPADATCNGAPGGRISYAISQETASVDSNGVVSYTTPETYTVTATAAPTLICPGTTVTYSVTAKWNAPDLVWTSMATNNGSSTGAPVSAVYTSDPQVAEGPSTSNVTAAVANGAAVPEGCTITYANSSDSAATISADGSNMILTAVAPGATTVTVTMCADSTQYAPKSLTLPVTVGVQADAVISNYRIMRDKYIAYVNALEAAGEFLPDDPQQATPAQMADLYSDPNWMFTSPWTVSNDITDNKKTTDSSGQQVTYNNRTNLMNSMSAMRYFLRTKTYAMSLVKRIFADSLQNQPSRIVDNREILYVTRNFTYTPKFAVSGTGSTFSATLSPATRIKISDPDSALLSLPTTPRYKNLYFTFDSVNWWGQMCPNGTWPSCTTVANFNPSSKFAGNGGLQLHEVLHNMGYNHGNQDSAKKLLTYLGLPAENGYKMTFDGVEIRGDDVNDGMQKAFGDAIKGSANFNNASAGLYSHFNNYRQYDLQSCCAGPGTPQPPYDAWPTPTPTPTP